ncbi:MAG: hypothetical protein QXJ74_06785 [Nitrososphaera sp.]|uniref:hypothetical protein n=1 Tax=Nitrososphaera sp. TaxID=1971748 RepID=UPI00184533F7|nr:hypothetical protein [Nitrososphaera sp.]NWG37515.1 hypothetical protein [Nitrososphaera sp.]
MAKYDGIKSQELLDFEKTKDELTLIFKDNRYLFIKIKNGDLAVDLAACNSAKGQELQSVEEGNGEITLVFKGFKLPVKAQSGNLEIDSIPE